MDEKKEWTPQWVWLRMGVQIKFDKHPEDMGELYDSIKENGLMIDGHACIPGIVSEEELGLGYEDYDYYNPLVYVKTEEIEEHTE